MATPSTREHDPTRGSLLDRVMASTVDNEYAEVARSRSTHQPSTGFSVGAIVVVAIFGLMVGVSALRTAQSAPLVEQQREALVAEVREQRDALDGQQQAVVELQAENQELQERLGREVFINERAAQRLELQSFNAGALPVSGPGLRIVAGDGPASGGQDGQVQDTDLQMMINGLWEAGAEAITINRHRIGPRTAIRTAGSAITVNYISLAQPYVIQVVGDPDTLQARFLETDGGQLWMSLSTNFGFTLEIENADELQLPGNAAEHLLYAKGEDR